MQVVPEYKLGQLDLAAVGDEKQKGWKRQDDDPPISPSNGASRLLSLTIKPPGAIHPAVSPLVTLSGDSPQWLTIDCTDPPPTHPPTHPREGATMSNFHSAPLIIVQHKFIQNLIHLNWFQQHWWDRVSNCRTSLKGERRSKVQSPELFSWSLLKTSFQHSHLHTVNMCDNEHSQMTSG